MTRPEDGLRLSSASGARQMPDDVRIIDVKFGDSSQNLFQSEGAVRFAVEAIQALARSGGHHLRIASPVQCLPNLRGQLDILLGEEGVSWSLTAQEPAAAANVQLFVETDQGDTWLQHAKATLKVRSGNPGCPTSRSSAGVRIAAARHAADKSDRNVSVVRNTASDLGPLLGLAKEKRRTPESLRRSAGLLRYHASMTGQDYLGTFPFEEAEFIVATGEDLPLANLVRAGEMAARLVRRHRQNVKLFTFAAPGTGLLTRRAQEECLTRDIIAMPSPPPDVRAALLHCATAAIHPAFHETTYGAFGFFDAASVGTPCLIADGPHTRELLEDEPSLADLVFAPYQIDQMQRLYTAVAQDRERYVNLATASHARVLRRRSGARVAKALVEAAKAASSRK